MILHGLMAVCFVTCVVLPSSAVNAQDIADQLRAVERARLRSLAEADVETARRLHADDFELINPVGGTLSKEQYLRDVASGELDYVDGKNLVIERRVHTSDLAARADELARMDLELIGAAALPQALKVRRNNPAMPMVIGTCPGVVSNGFARSINRPGGHYTGMDELPPGVTAKRLRLLKAASCLAPS